MKNTSYRFVYLPGLGFTCEVFGLLHPEGSEVVHLEWQAPLHRESLREYSLRLIEGLPAFDGKTVIVAYSFGGLVAQEIHKHVQADSIYLISSIRSGAENPLRFRLIGRLGLHWLFTKRLIFWSFPFWKRQFGFSEKAAQDLFLRMVSRQDNRYLQWALYQLAIWEGPSEPVDVRQIHGAKDRTFPIQKLKEVDHVVEDGNHMMVYYQSEVLKELIQAEVLG
jgi:pimeloyl-ACP methyl ester carboxylesterase